MITFSERRYEQEIPENKEFILGADIGGTNSNFGLFAIDGNKLSPLLLSVHTKSRYITDFSSLVVDLLAYLKENHGINNIKKACFGAAGVASQDHDSAKPTTLDFVIDAASIKRATGLQEVLIINDFEAVAYGIEGLENKDLIVVHEGKPRNKENKAIIGAGTGLGKCILGFDEHDAQYVPIPSEGGHADFPVYDQRELDLIEFIKSSYAKASADKEEVRYNCPISWEDLLSGRGIMRIYAFLSTLNNYKKSEQSEHIANDGPHPDYIFGHWERDPQCCDTFKMYAGFYGRCAKDFALETLALGGIYIAGGIAEKNLDLFDQSEFRTQFLACGKQRYLLEDIPITVIGNYNVSLYGAARYLLER